MNVVKQVKAIIFDKDGTLMAFDPYWAAVADAALSALSLQLGVGQYQYEMKRSIGLLGNTTEKNSIIQKGTYEQAAEAINTVLKNVKSPARVSGREIETIFTQSAEAGTVCPACEGLSLLMKRLRDKGILLFLVTTDISAITYRCLDELGITGCFQEIITDDGNLPPKPDPAAIRYLLQKYGLQPDEICMVGDTQTDMIFAQEGGITGICVGDGGFENPGSIQIPDVSYLETVIE